MKIQTRMKYGKLRHQMKPTPSSTHTALRRVYVDVPMIRLGSACCNRVGCRVAWMSNFKRGNFTLNAVYLTHAARCMFHGRDVSDVSEKDRDKE